MIHLDMTCEEALRYLACAIEQQKILIRDARKCGLRSLCDSRRARLNQLRKELAALNNKGR